MKLQILLPWVVVLALSAALASVFLASHKKDAELATLREESQKSQSLQTELDEAKTQSKAQEEELTTLRKDKQDLLRLRNEVAQMQQRQQQLTQQAQSAQAEAERAKSRAAQLTQGVQQMQQLQAENQQLRTVAVQSQEALQRNACINILRQLQGAKEQWALEHSKTANDIPVPQDILAYLPNKAAPVCPAGGQYALNAVGQAPTCSFQGHVLPQ